MYVSRKVLNADDVRKWALDSGFKSVVHADKMHVTIAYSKSPVRIHTAPLDHESMRVAPDRRSVHKFDGDDAHVLLIHHPELVDHWKKFLDHGASWDFRHTKPEYKPHLTISYEKQDRDLVGVKPFDGEILLGPEVAESLKSGCGQSLAKSQSPAALFFML